MISNVSDWISEEEEEIKRNIELYEYVVYAELWIDITYIGDMNISILASNKTNIQSARTNAQRMMNSE